MLEEFAVFKITATKESGLGGKFIAMVINMVGIYSGVFIVSYIIALGFKLGTQ